MNLIEKKGKTIYKKQLCPVCHKTLVTSQFKSNIVVFQKGNHYIPSLYFCNECKTHFYSWGYNYFATILPLNPNRGIIEYFFFQQSLSDNMKTFIQQIKERTKQKDKQRYEGL